MIARRSQRLRIWGIAALALLALQARAAAEPEDLDRLWIPSLGLGFDVQVEPAASATVSSALRGSFSDAQTWISSPGRAGRIVRNL